MTGGQVHTGGIGILSIAGGTGDTLINMTGGQIGAAAQRAGTDGINASSSGGDITIVARDTFASDNGIQAIVGGGTGNIDITVNGAIDALTGNGVDTENNGAGGTNITVNSAVSGIIGIHVVNGPTTVVNRATISGTTSQVAVEFGPDDDTCDAGPVRLSVRSKDLAVTTCSSVGTGARRSTATLASTQWTTPAPPDP